MTGAAQSPVAYLPLRQVTAVGIGNALAFYDFLVFSFFAIQIGHSFFPRSQTSHGLLYTLATFGVGFLTRPLGGAVIGIYGDRAGRKPAMLLCFGLMGVAILGMALTPGYAQIGVAAPVLLVLFRLLQGFALGGEVGPSTAFLIEAAPPQRRGLYVAVQWATQDSAVLIAGLIGALLANLLSPVALDTWGWRLAFVAGAAIVPFGWTLRKNLPETFHRSAASAHPTPHHRPPAFLLVLAFVVLSVIAIGNYVVAYMATYGQRTLGLAPAVAFGAAIVCGAVQTSTDLAGGLACDRFGRKPVLLASLGGLCLLVLPCFIAMEHFRSAAALYGAGAVMGFLVSGICGPALVSITEALPRDIRSGTLAILYAVAITMFGGTTEFILEYLTEATGNPLAPAWYLTGAAVIGLGFVIFMRESAPFAPVARARDRTLQ